jgi:MFS family permease
MTNTTAVSISTWKLLRTSPDFSKLVTARTVSTLGDHIHTVTTMRLVKELTGSAVAMASVFIANTIPRVVFSLLGGVSVDRYNRKLILVLSDSLRAAGILGLVWLALAHDLQVWHVALFAAFNGAVGSFFSPAVSATLPHLVDKEGLQKANALNSMGVRIAGIAGGALGGVVIGAADVWAGYLMDAVSYGISALLVWSMAIPKPEQIPGQPLSPGIAGVYKDLKEGLAYVFSQQTLLWLVLLSVAMSFVTLPVAQLIPALAEETHLTDPRQVGFLWSGMTLGLFAGAVLLNFVNLSNQVLGALASAVLCGCSSILLGLSYVYPLTLTGFILMGFSISLFTLLTTTLFQTMVPKEMQGRFFGNIGLLTLGLQPVVMWLAGVAADSSSTTAVFTNLGGFLLVFILAWTLLPRRSIGVFK